MSNGVLARFLSLAPSGIAMPLHALDRTSRAPFCICADEEFRPSLIMEVTNDGKTRTVTFDRKLLEVHQAWL
jgi:hypothetical protein